MTSDATRQMAAPNVDVLSAHLVELASSTTHPGWPRTSSSMSLEDDARPTGVRAS